MKSKSIILLKISGGHLKNNDKNFLFDDDALDDITDQIKKLSQNYSVGIVLGGGNIWRGKDNFLNDLSDVYSDYVGMLSTIINGVVLKDLLHKKNVKTRLFSALNVEKITEAINPCFVEKAFENNEVIIFSGGTGLPFVTTDTAAIIRSLEIGASIILSGKDGVDGVYDKDPNKYENTVFYPFLTYDEIVSKELQVMDNASLLLAKQHDLKILVFDQSLKNCFVDALEHKIKLTVVSNKKN